MGWGMGSLQEIDHVPFVAPVTKYAATPGSTAEIPGALDEAFAAALTPHYGPAFVDFSLDHVFSELDTEPEPSVDVPVPGEGPAADVEQAAARLRGARRPVIMAGTNLYWGHGERELLELVEALRIPVFLNGQARGCVPADHELFFSRARSHALKGADVALVIGVPMDFRLGFGGSFGDETKIVAIDVAPPQRPHPRAVAAEAYGALPATLRALREAVGSRSKGDWPGELRATEDEKRAGERAELDDDRAPL